MSGSNQFPAPQPDPRHVQQWTLTDQSDEGQRHMPIADGKYHDRDTGEVRSVAPGDRLVSGPPAIDQYWHNIGAASRDEFSKMRGSFHKDITEFMIRLGDFLQKGNCKIHSVNATEFSVTVIVKTVQKTHEINEDLKACRLIYTLD
ncbi:hypothetical protein CDEST_14984 [Colletotrichum destructivum]|uniref:Uncharacterized protein n=1 Tax=Colletotrichum destructivum TaxID=34406 RepID=A0AAX4J3G2_9PEZI|nr:hypothetical protein CDEST_14984 [Colletotrichum destructivum]